MTFPDSRIKRPYRVGRLIRRQFRAMLDSNSVQYVEHKGWFDSIFVVNAYQASHNAIEDMIWRYSR